MPAWEILGLAFFEFILYGGNNMYSVTRKNRIKEDLQICHANGDVALTVSVDLNIDEMRGRLNKSLETFAAAQAMLENGNRGPEAMEAYGNAVIALFDVIFGEEDSRRIIAFYENNYTEMLLDVFPFINDEILPKIREASSARREMLENAAKKTKRFSPWR